MRSVVFICELQPCPVFLHLLHTENGFNELFLFLPLPRLPQHGQLLGLNRMSVELVEDVESPIGLLVEQYFKPLPQRPSLHLQDHSPQLLLVEPGVIVVRLLPNVEVLSDILL